MGIKVACECGRNYSVKQRFAGKSIKCKSCGSTIDVPNESDDDELVDDLHPAKSKTSTTGPSNFIEDPLGVIVAFNKDPLGWAGDHPAELAGAYAALAVIGVLLAGILYLFGVNDEGLYFLAALPWLTLLHMRIFYAYFKPTWNNAMAQTNFSFIRLGILLMLLFVASSIPLMYVQKAVLQACGVELVGEEEQQD